MNVERVADSLNALGRLVVVGVIAVAVGVDTILTLNWRQASEPFERLALSTLSGAIGVLWVVSRRHPLVAALVAGGASLLASTTTGGGRDGSGTALFTELVVLPLMFGAALSTKSSWRWPVAAWVVMAAAFVALRVQEGIARVVAGLALSVLLGAGAAVVIYIHLRDSERLASIERARHQERLELARDLHDVVGHHVTGIVVLAQARRFTAAQKGVTTAGDDTLVAIEQAGLETLTSIRRLVGMLRDDAPTTTGPQVADIETIVHDLRTTHPGAALTIDSDIRRFWVPAELAATVQRLAQELATNVRKHGDPAGAASIELRRTADAIELWASNTSTGQAPGTGYGLVGMRERVEALGGTFAAGLDGERRWVARCSVPLAAPKRPEAQR